MLEIFLSCGNVIFLGFENSKPVFLSFLEVHQKTQLSVNFLTTKWHILWSNKGAQFIKNSRDYKKGVKSCNRPLHLVFLWNPLKILWSRYFKKRTTDLLENQFKLIFSRSFITWNWRNSLKWKWPFWRAVRRLFGLWAQPRRRSMR